MHALWWEHEKCGVSSNLKTGNDYAGNELAT